MSTSEGDGSGNAAARAIADGLCLAAAPIFAVMALLTRGGEGSPLELLCLTAHESSPFGGMVTMYLLMSVVHAAPWLRLIAGRLGPALTRENI